MVKLKKILAASAAAIALLLPSAYSVSVKQPATTASAVYVYDQEVSCNAPETAVVLRDNAETTEKKTETKEKKKFSPVRSLIISLVISLIIAFVVVSSMKSKMKTVRRQSGASSYTKDNSFKLEINTDTYLYNKIDKSARQQS